MVSTNKMFPFSVYWISIADLHMPTSVFAYVMSLCRVQRYTSHQLHRMQLCSEVHSCIAIAKISTKNPIHHPCILRLCHAKYCVCPSEFCTEQKFVLITFK